MKILKLGWLNKICLAMWLYAVAQFAHAQEAPDASLNGPVVQGFGNFIKKIGSLTNSAISQPDFLYFVNLLFLVGTISLIVFTLAQYMLKRLQYHDVATTVFLILMVQVLMTGYNQWTDAAWQATEGVASSLQMGMIGTRDSFFAPQFIANIFKSITFESVLSANLYKVFIAAAHVVILSVFTLILSALAYVSIIWGFWGFTLAKLIGLLFLPSLLLERTSFLFDGWLRFFLGFLVYYLIARVNIVLVASSLAIYYNIGIPFAVNQPKPIEMPVMASMFDAMGVFTFVLVGVLSLFSVSSFAGTIISGAAGGGIGKAMLGAARSMAKFV